jgi:DNA processing protein
MNDEIYMLWLSSLHTLGSRKQNDLLGRFGTAREIFNAPESLLRASEVATPHNINIITEHRSLDYIEELLKTMEAHKIVYVSRKSPSFPSLLKEIPDPPVGLFYIGELPADGTRCAAIIGSRRCSEYGLSAARMISKPLAGSGVVIVSGMARGTDSMAHRSAIEGGGQTIAVLGCGADVCYPPENKNLREEIISNGCVVTEYPPGVQPFQGHFPARNRIISGLSSVVVVVEAARKSGTLITVEQAADQGREIMAVPGSIASKLSEGTNKLISEGALPVMDYMDVLLALGINPAQAHASEKSTGKAVKLKLDSLAHEEKIVYDSLTFEPVAFDRLAALTKMPAGGLHYALTMLELKGFIKKLPGSRFIRNI